MTISELSFDLMIDEAELTSREESRLKILHTFFVQSVPENILKMLSCKELASRFIDVSDGEVNESSYTQYEIDEAYEYLKNYCNDEYRELLQIAYFEPEGTSNE